MSTHPSIHIEYPDWVDQVIDWNRDYHSDQDRMSLAITIARENVERSTGGPFGAAIFESESGKDLVDLTITIAAMNAFNRLGAPFRLPVKAKP